MFGIRSNLISQSTFGMKNPMKPKSLFRFYAKAFPMIKDPRAQKLYFNKSMNSEELGLEKSLDRKEIVRVTDRVLRKNPHGTITDLLFKQPWNIERFNRENLPTVIDQLDNPKAFSERGDCYFLFMDMPIKMPGKGWKIPVELKQFQETIQKAMQFEKLINPNFQKCYSYLTIDQREVEPNGSQRRTGYHADSYINKETRLNTTDTASLETDSIYLVSDSIPTEFCKGPFPFGDLNPNDTEAVLKHFDEIGADKPVITYPDYTLIRMGPECVHRVGFNKTAHTIKRTFLKITVSRQILNRQGNEHNSLFDYNWPMIPRSETKRNHANVVYEPPKDPNVEFQYWSTEKINHIFNNSTLKRACKSSTVKASLATPGELLQTDDGNFPTTVNEAKSGDWKITTKTGSQYFLPPKLFEKFYLPDTTKPGEFLSQPNHIPYVPIGNHIKIEAPWGRVQYLRPGDYLVKRGIGDIYGVLKKDFESSYKK